MHKILKLFFIFLRVNFIHCSEEVLPIFTAVASRSIFSNSTYNVSISVENSRISETSFTAILTSVNADPQESFTSQKILVKSGTLAVLEFPVQQLKNSEYTLTLKAGESERIFQDHVRVFVEKRQKLFLVQTDRPKYKPGEIVKFRVLGLDNSFKPLNTNGGNENIIQIKITDSQQNLIKGWKNVTIQNGLHSSEFRLSSEPNLGNWLIEIQNLAGEKLTEVQIDVANYVLPMFKVGIVIQKSTRGVNNSKISAEIKMTYPFGQEVQEANCTVSLTKQNSQFSTPVIKNLVISGSGVVDLEFPTVEVSYGRRRLEQLEVKANCKDTSTSLQSEGIETLTMHGVQGEYVIQFLDEGKRVIRGIPFNLRFKVTTADGTPVKDSSSDAFTLIMLKSDGYEIVLRSSIPSNGIAVFKINTNEQLSHSIKGNYKNMTMRAVINPQFLEESKIAMDVELFTESPSVGEEIELKVTSTHNMESFNYLFYGNGDFLSTGRIDLATATKAHKFKVRLPFCSISKMAIVVYSSFKPNNEIKAAYLQFPVSKRLKNNLEIRVTPKTVEPGQNVTISIKTEPGSLVALTGIDNRHGGQISLENLLQTIKSSSSFTRTKLHGGSQTFRLFEQVGIVILTNGNLVKQRWDLPTTTATTSTISPQPRNSGNLLKLQSRKANLKQLTAMAHSRENEIRIRKHFQELWLWEELWVTNESTGLLEIQRTVPDSLTAWNISGFSLSPTKGLGICIHPQTITTFRPFFITLNVPNKVIFGEIFSLVVAVHNYENRTITADITLENSKNIFELQGQNPSWTKQVSVVRLKVSSVTFVLNPRQFGNLTLDVTAKTTAGASDAVQKSLIVKPPGVKKFITKTIFMKHKSDISQDYNFKTDLPKNRVNGATIAQLTVSGDVFAPVVKNLNHLINMPFGCGEQNLLRFVAGIATLKYLTARSKLTPKLNKEIINILETGYQRQLTFLHSDGSTSAFGRKNDGRGSTWLTAYAIKSLIQAKPFITVDDNVIAQGLKFLASKQLENGNFEETGQAIRIYSGDVDDSLTAKANTAYTVLTFLAAEEKLQKFYEKQIKKGLNFISEQQINNTFALSLVTYALQLANHTKKDEFFKLTKDRITMEAINAQHTSYTVETISYALLTYLERGQIEESLPFVKYLMKRRNSHGGFSSFTQGTVVGLTALAKYAQLTTTDDDTDLTINLKGSNDQIKINEENYMDLQELFLPEPVGKDSQEINLTVNGKGTGWAQVTWIYYTEGSKIKNPAFVVNVKSKKLYAMLEMNICTSYHPPAEKKNTNVNVSSNMAIVEINLPSGYEFSATQGLYTLSLTPELKRHELEEGGSKLITYFDSFNATEVCFGVYALKSFEMKKEVQGYVEAYDYYEPSRRGRTYM